MDRPDHGRSRARRQRLGDRLVQLHRAAQSDAGRLQDRQGGRVRDRAARQEAWPDLSHRSRTMPRPTCRRWLARRRRPSQTGRGPGPSATCSGACTPSGCWSNAARRTCVPALVKLGADPPADSIGINVGAIHALWTLDGLRAIDGQTGCQLLASRLRHPSPGVRRNAVLVLPRTTGAALGRGVGQSPGSAHHSRTPSCAWRRCWPWPICRPTGDVGSGRRRWSSVNAIRRSLVPTPHCWPPP